MTRITSYALVAALVVTTTAAAQPVPTRGVGFDEAIGLVAGLPELAAARAAVVSTRRVVVPRPWGALLITVSPELRGAPSDARGVEGALAVQQAIPLDDIGGARRAHLGALADAEAAAAAAALLDARLTAAAAWIDGWAARERRSAAERDLALASDIVTATERGVAAGAFTAPELADARAFAAEAEVRRADADGQVSDAAFALAAATARPGAVTSDGDLPEAPLPDPATWDALLARARSLPHVVARRLTARADRARAIEERAARGHQLIVGGELVRDAPDGLLVGVTLGVALPHDRGDREAALAERDAALADGEADGLAARAAIELARARHDVEHTGELLGLLRDQLVPLADDAAARRQRAFQVGETTVVELLAARRAALAAHARLADARAAHAWARVHAWFLIQATEAP